MKTTKNINELTPLETALQQQFKPDANSVRAAFQAVENDRAKFAINSVKFGLCALAAKAIVGHGKFEAWICAALCENGNVRPIAVSTAQDYIHTAAELVEKLRNPAKLTGTLADAVVAFCEADGNKKYEDFDIAAVLADAKKTDFLLRIVFSNMSIRAFRNLLRDGAERADSEKNAKQTALTKRELKSLANSADENSQTNFFDALFTETRATIETSRSDARFVEMSAEQLINYGNYLIAQGKDIVDIGNKKKD